MSELALEQEKSQAPEQSISFLNTSLHKHSLLDTGFFSPTLGISIIHIGCGGGTGGPILSGILRLLGNIKHHNSEEINVKYYGFDPDIFEEKNLKRQLCTRKDIGVNKAQTLVSKYSRAFGLKSGTSFYIDKPYEGESLLALCSPITIVIDTVDNNKCRLDIYKELKRLIEGKEKAICHPRYSNTGATTPQSEQLEYLYQLSCGNGEWTGQFIWGGGKIGKNIDPNVNRTIVDPAYMFSLPLPGLVAPEMIDPAVDLAEVEMSCAERASVNEQSFIANQTAANLCINWMAALLKKWEFNNECKEYVKAHIPLGSFDKGPALYTGYTNTLGKSMEDIAREVMQTRCMIKFSSVNNAFTEKLIDKDYFRAHGIHMYDKRGILNTILTGDTVAEYHSRVTKEKVENARVENVKVEPPQEIAVESEE